MSEKCSFIQIFWETEKKNLNEMMQFVWFLREMLSICLKGWFIFVRCWDRSLWGKVWRLNQQEVLLKHSKCWSSGRIIVARQDILLVYALIGLLTFSGKEFKTLIVSLWTVAWGIAYKRLHYWLSPLSWHWAVGPSPEPFNLLKTCIFSTVKLCFPYLYTTSCQFSQIIKSYLQIHKLIFKYSPFQWSITIQTTLLIDLWKPKGILFNTAIEA